MKSMSLTPIEQRVPECAEPAACVVALDDPRAVEATLAGAKAANLARAAIAGLPVLPGFVIPTGRRPEESVLREAWDGLSRGGRLSLVVRSSSTVEDAERSSMAGQFRSVLGVRGWPAFEQAVGEVLHSAVRLAGPGTAPAPMAVLVQVELAPECAGVLFGVDPVTGDRRRLMVEAVAGSPHTLVSGTVTADRYLMTRRGHVLEGSEDKLLDGPRRRRLAGLARWAEGVFGSPQDVEWAFDGDDRLWMLQSRPVTATGRHHDATGPVLGPGPVSETFPEPLRPLEVDLWVEPLRQAIGHALRLSGAVSRRRLAESPVVTTVGKRVAVDLELLGAAPTHHAIAAALDPRRPARRLMAAWRVGRLRAALPAVVTQTLRQMDRDLASVPALSSLADDQLVRLLRRLTEALVPLSSHEVLCGMLLHAGDGAQTAASVALAELAAARAAGCPDEEIFRRRPAVLALVPPRVGEPCRPPAVDAVTPVPQGVAALSGREALRLRARWAQELGARAATELGARLPLGAPELVAWLKLDELAAVAGGAPAPADLAARTEAPTAPPLPASFRLTADGEVVPVSTSHPPAGGRAAGGGRGVGPVCHDPVSGSEAVLVVEHLTPELAAALPGLAGLVSETGSTLSHLAILARELGVPTVVGVAEARKRFPPGAVVVVDGATGEVSLVTESEGEDR